jgi:hypothetical protein
LVLVWGPGVWADCTPQQLQTALTTETPAPPVSLGLTAFTAGATRNDAQLVFLMNQARSGAFYEQNAGIIPAYAIVRAFDPNEYGGLTAAKYQALSPLLAPGLVDTSNDNVRTILGAIFPASGPTRAALILLSKRPGSYAEVVCGRPVTLEEVTIALGVTP